MVVAYAVRRWGDGCDAVARWLRTRCDGGSKVVGAVVARWCEGRTTVRGATVVAYAVRGATAVASNQRNIPVEGK